MQIIYFSTDITIGWKDSKVRERPKLKVSGIIKTIKQPHSVDTTGQHNWYNNMQVESAWKHN